MRVIYVANLAFRVAVPISDILTSEQRIDYQCRNWVELKKIAVLVWYNATLVITVRQVPAIIGGIGNICVPRALHIV